MYRVIHHPVTSVFKTSDHGTWKHFRISTVEEKKTQLTFLVTFHVSINDESNKPVTERETVIINGKLVTNVGIMLVITE